MENYPVLVVRENGFADGADRPILDNPGASSLEDESANNISMTPAFGPPGVPLVLDDQRLEERAAEAWPSVSSIERSYKSTIPIDFIL